MLFSCFQEKGFPVSPSSNIPRDGMNGAGQPPTQQWNFIDYDTLATFHQDAYSYGHRSSSSVNDVENIQMRMNELQARYSVNPYTMMEAWQYPREKRRKIAIFCRILGKNPKKFHEILLKF